MFRRSSTAASFRADVVDMNKKFPRSYKWQNFKWEMPLTCPPQETFPGRKEPHLPQPHLKDPYRYLHLALFVPIDKYTISEHLPVSHCYKLLFLIHLMATKHRGGPRRKKTRHQQLRTSTAIT